MLFVHVPESMSYWTRPVVACGSPDQFWTEALLTHPPYINPFPMLETPTPPPYETLLMPDWGGEKASHWL